MDQTWYYTTPPNNATPTVRRTMVKYQPHRNRCFFTREHISSGKGVVSASTKTNNQQKVPRFFRGFTPCTMDDPKHDKEVPWSQFQSQPVV